MAESQQRATNNKRLRIIVFGGARGMGLWTADFLARSGYEITIADIYEKTPDIAEKRGFLRGVVLTDDDITPLIADDGYCDCHVAVIAVRIDATLDVIRLVGPRLRTGSLLMDITSLKGPAMQAMDNAVNPGVAVLGTHPIFGPDALSFFGQTCVIVPGQVHPSGHWLEWWVHLLEQEGAFHIKSTAEDHDRMMLAVQVLLHYVLICFGATLPQVGVDLNRANLFKSPMYEIGIGLVSRILSQPAETYYWIQKNPDGEMVRNLFMQCSNKISDTFKESTFPQYDKLRLAIKEGIGKTNIDAFSSVAATLIQNLAIQKKALMETEGKMACIENVESHKIHYGFIQEISPHLVTIKTMKKRGEIVKISLKKARLLTPEETNTWKVQHLRLERRALSFLAPQEADPQVIVNLVSNRFGVTEVTVVKVYSDSELMTGKKKVMLTVSLTADKKGTADEEGEAAYSDIKKVLEGIGYILL